MSSITLRLIAGRSVFFRYLKRLSEETSARLARAGEWVRLTLRRKVSGNISIVPLIGGNTVDFLLTEKRDKPAAIGFFDKAICHSAVPEKITMDKSKANKAAIDKIDNNRDFPIEVR